MMATAATPPAPRLETLLAGIALASGPLPPRLATLPVRGLQLDSRAVRPGDIFVALPGARADGRAFIAQAAAAGAVAVIAEAAGLDAVMAAAAPASSAIPVLGIAGLAEQLSTIAGRWYGDPSQSLAVTGVTGTNGKTTVTQLLARLLARLGEASAVVGTLGWGAIDDAAGVAVLAETGMTTPDAIRTQAILASLRDLGVRRVALEVSSHSLAQHRVAAVRFAAAIYTNLSRDHLDYHGDMDSYFAAKAALFQTPGLGCAIVNAEDPLAARLCASLPTQLTTYTYAVEAPTAELYLRKLTLSARGFSAELVSPWGNGWVRSPLLGRFNAANLLAVIAAACAQGCALADVLAVLPTLTPVRGRMEVVAAASGATAAPTVVVDYAHTPDALAQALTTLRATTAGQLWCVFGCGGDRDRGKRPEMGAIAARLADRVVVTSDNPRSEAADAIIADILSGISLSGISLSGIGPADTGAAAPPVSAFSDRREAIRRAVCAAAAGDTVLIAGKGHETYQLIGARRWPFDDVAEARRALRERGGEPT